MYWFCSTNISWDGEGEGVNEGWVSSDLFSYLGLEQWFGEGRGTRPPPPARGGSGMVRGFRRGGERWRGGEGSAILITVGVPDGRGITGGLADCFGSRLWRGNGRWFGDFDQGRGARRAGYHGGQLDWHDRFGRFPTIHFDVTHHCFALEGPRDA